MFKQQFILPLLLSLTLLSACSPSKAPTQTPETEQDRKIKKFMQTDLSEQSTPNDEVPDHAEMDSNPAPQVDEALSSEQPEAETPAQIEEQFDILVYRAEAPRNDDRLYRQSRYHFTQ